MVKKVSIYVTILAILIGIGAVYMKTMREEADVKGITTEILQTPTEKVNQPEKSFETLNQTSSPTPSSAAVQTTGQPTAEKGPYPMEIDTKKAYTAVLKTSVGDITISLNASKTPITVNNFVALAKRKFYNNSIFHRIIKGFMIQGGDPKGNGTGGPGYTFNDEPFDGEYTRGTVAMANAGPNTNGSQFFIMHADTSLPKSYVIFGTVTKGIDVVDTIANSPTKPGGEGSTPVTPTTITSVEIVEQ